MKKRRFISMGVAVLVATQGVLPLSAAERRIPDGTRVSVRLTDQLSSATVGNGDVINFSVVEDLRVNGEVVVKQGTSVRGVVMEASAKRRMGRAGHVSYSITETKAVDDTTIRLRAVRDSQGESHVASTAVATAAVAALVLPAAPLLLLRKGKDIVIPAGTRVDAFVDGEHVVRTDAAEASPPPSKAIAPTGLTNADVLSLHRAGFGDEVILAKIAAGSAVFNVDAADLLALKKAGLSDRIIAAMVKANR